MHGQRFAETWLFKDLRKRFSSSYGVELWHDLDYQAAMAQSNPHHQVGSFWRFCEMVLHFPWDAQYMCPICVRRLISHTVIMWAAQSVRWELLYLFWERLIKT